MPIFDICREKSVFFIFIIIFCSNMQLMALDTGVRCLVADIPQPPITTTIKRQKKAIVILMMSNF